jgi:hypothetical protein
MPGKNYGATWTFCLPVTVRHHRTGTARCRIRADAKAHILPYVIVTVLCSHYGMRDFVQDGVDHMLVRVAFYVMFRQLNTAVVLLAYAEPSFVLIEFEGPIF